MEKRHEIHFLGTQPKQTTAEWLRAEQEKHWDVF